MYNFKLISYTMILLIALTLFIPAPITNASALDSVVSAVMSPTNSAAGGGGILNGLFDLLFNKFLSPLLHLNGNLPANAPSAGKSPVQVIPLPSSGGGTVQDHGVLQGKTIVLDPGHGGSNPGATANNTRESDNNLAVGLKLRDQLERAGAHVVMTRDSDRTVAPEGETLGQELQARLDIADANHADIFVSLHSNENSDTSIAGATTFYHSDSSAALASDVQNALVKETGAVDKGVSTANFYVLRNSTMPSILVEMGFVSNPDEAARLHNDAYREQIAQGVFNGLVRYFSNH